MGRYRLIDLGIWLVILAVFEAVAVNAAVRFTGQPYWVSVVPALCAIVMMRWGAWAGIHALVGGLVTSLAAGAGTRMCLIYGAGNLMGLAALLLIKLFGKEKLRGDALKSLLFAFTVFVLMQSGKALMSLALGEAPKQTIGLFAPEVVSLLFTLILIWIVRRLDGVFEDQKKYVARVQKEQEKERGDSL
ncbi:MAG: hypothetical protein II920_03960 [Clostridia bacterium]|nr:hypothetical protein [Clostridia bacterium]